ncbi:hypothetical protein D3C87_1684610 [compost metagenome]
MLMARVLAVTEAKGSLPVSAMITRPLGRVSYCAVGMHQSRTTPAGVSSSQPRRLPGK